LPLDAALRITRLSASRYYRWCRAEAGCELDDRSSCPRAVPTRLTPSEVESIREMAESNEHRHMSLRGLALHAQRIRKIVASPSTWCRLVRNAGWRRPRNRVVRFLADPKIPLDTNSVERALRGDAVGLKNHYGRPRCEPSGTQARSSWRANSSRRDSERIATIDSSAAKVGEWARTCADPARVGEDLQETGICTPAGRTRHFFDALLFLTYGLYRGS
jgi:hypothetical protein